MRQGVVGECRPAKRRNRLPDQIEPLALSRADPNAFDATTGPPVNPWGQMDQIGLIQNLNTRHITGTNLRQDLEHRLLLGMALGIGGILADAPSEGAVAPPLRRQFRDRLQEGRAVLAGNPVFDGDRDRTAIMRDRFGQCRLRPMR